MFEELLKVNSKSRLICSTTGAMIDIFHKCLLKIQPFTFVTEKSQFLHKIAQFEPIYTS